MASSPESEAARALRPMCRGGAGQAVLALVVASSIWTVLGDMMVFGRSCKAWLSRVLSWNSYNDECRCSQWKIRVMVVVDDFMKFVRKNRMSSSCPQGKRIS